MFATNEMISAVELDSSLLCEVENARHTLLMHANDIEETNGACLGAVYTNAAQRNTHTRALRKLAADIATALGACYNTLENVGAQRA